MTMMRGSMVLLLVAGIAHWASGCATTANGGGDGESHFLASCDQTCGGGFECVCGVCTKACIGDATCRALHDDATCGAAGACLSGGGRVCDVPCAGSQDCAAIGTGFACRSGSCRDAEFRQVGVPSRDGAVEDSTDSTVNRDSGVGRPDVAVAPPDVAIAPPDVQVGLPDVQVGSHDVQVPPNFDVIVPPDAEPCCAPGTVEWRTDDSGADRHRLSNCASYERFYGTDPVGCASGLPYCGSEGITPFDIRGALADDGVRTAVEGARVTFGGPGQMDIVAIDGHELQLSKSPCGGTPGCVEVPDGLRRLLDILHAVESQQLGRNQCRPDPACYLPPDSGVCTALIPRYRYDPDTGTCLPFTYGGCLGNGNRFETIAACQSACDFDACLLGIPTAPGDAGACAGFMAEGRCFSEFQGACACSCSRRGRDPNRCALSGNQASCG